MLRFAEPIYNAWPLWFSPGQSTFCRNFTLRAWPHIVPKSEMTENCRLHNKICMGNNFCGQRAATTYCGTAL
jgi:hypothetical protein